MDESLQRSKGFVHQWGFLSINDITNEDREYYEKNLFHFYSYRPEI